MFKHRGLIVLALVALFGLQACVAPPPRERVVYREFFPRGLTALDELDEETLGTRPNLSHVTAREEVVALLNALQLPLSENGKRRAAARAEWYSVMDQPLQVHDILA